MCRAHNNNTAVSSLGKGGSAVNSPLGTSQTSLCSPPSSLPFAQSPPASRAFLCGRLPSLPSRTPWSFSSPPSQPLSPPMFSPHRPHGSRPLSGVQSSSFSSSAQKLQSGVEEKGGVGVSTIQQAQRSLAETRAPRGDQLTVARGVGDHLGGIVDCCLRRDFQNPPNDRDEFYNDRALIAMI